MLIVISPSKSMDMDPVTGVDASQPEFLDHSNVLIKKLQRYSTAELMQFMGISKNLAELNRQRFRNWSPPFSIKNAKPALMAFTGDVYEGLDASSLDKNGIRYAQKNLRILSGLYGLLSPLDLIQPYRLEMGRPLQTRGARNLYEFWSGPITDALNAAPGDLLVNLASQEYFKAINKRTLNKRIISPVFKDEKNGQYKIISFYAKKARGTMARHIIENRVSTADGLLDFSSDGYCYNPDLSTSEQPVFTHSEA